MFPRYRTMGPTVYQNQSFHIRNHVPHYHIIPTAQEGDSIDVVAWPILEEKFELSG